ncbi:OmpA family protein [Flavobacteriaceae bacterium S356]|uniref:OmpA family protein n=1 Tax=Asprobacillus argus TaxID=3076534 RepID=A0ABU3LCY2_9FLAO|nr:OmpA family protein [Flavobacteriaceae bacterium S356]
MKPTNKLVAIIVVFLATTVFSYGQTRQLERANKKYDEYEYINATDIYLKVAESGYQSEELYTRLSNALYFNSRYREAAKWYKKLYDLSRGDVSSDILLRYSQSLKAIGRSRQAAKMYDAFLKESKVLNDDLASAKDYLAIIEENSNRYKIDSLSINSDNIDFGAHMRDSVLYFSSTRSKRKSVKRIDTWTNEPFLNIYTATYDIETKSYEEPIELKGVINTKYHESTPVLTKDGKTMYFTRSNNSKKYNEDKNAIAQLKIYRATKIEGRWTNIEDLAINGETFSNAHPVLSPKEDRLFYVSNMAGGYGQTDLYYVDILANGSLGKPMNLGHKVNTKGRESFPFITSDYELYFSSDGHFGLGGYDVFYLDYGTKEKQLVNVGKPINSPRDDYAFSIDNLSKKGFFSSNRGKSDDIYSLVETKPIKEILEQEIHGLVTDKQTNVPITNSIVTVNNQDNEVVSEVRTDEIGRFTVSVNRFKIHTLLAQKKDYNPESIVISKKNENTNVHIQLGKNIEKVEEGVDIAKLLNVVIYFDFDKSDIREDAKVELEKVFVALKQYPMIKLDLRAHTDSKGEAVYNQRLSERRALAAMQYLLSKGISKDRLTAKGFGEKELTNACKDGVVCSEQEHQQNRRTEFIIVE